ncbi:hypothetical protein D7D52_07985 [Nocardia yunnanensis]|uniref:MmpS family membrane protein n=1 Tax=Nocardia yunnanensis TaxID=2382165 RepID=A0A386Z9H0_9NOCA|nr:hypothetical protein [Nocardia yunnanensis]AYF73813.1 hypothetical protein D7D52_07985 [Nocardia yunnanensis]
MRFIIAALTAATATLFVTGCTPNDSAGGAASDHPGSTDTAGPSSRSGSSANLSAGPRSATTGPTSKSAGKSYTVIVEIHGSGNVTNMTWQIASETHMGGQTVKPGSPVHVERTLTADSPFPVKIYGGTLPGAELRCSITVNGTVVVETPSTTKGLDCETFVQAG